MSRQVTMLSVALVAALVGSYLKWTSEEGTDDADTIVVLDAKADQIEEVGWSSEKLDMTLSSRKDDKGAWLLIKATEHKKRPLPPEPGALTPDEGVDDGTAEGEEPAAEEPAAEERFEVVDETTEFKGGDDADKLLEALAPMVARRALEGVGDDKLDELGLAEPEGTLTVKRAGKDVRTFALGGEAYGTKDRYLRDNDSGKVYLVEDALMRSLKYGPTRLPDRELLGIDAEKLQSLAVQRPAAGAEPELRTTLVQSNRSDPKLAFWAPEGQAEKDESADTWVNKLLRIRSASFVQADETPTATATVAVIEATGADGERTRLELIKGTDPDGREAWYAKSTHTRLLVKLHASQAEGVVEDLETFMEPAESE